MNEMKGLNLLELDVLKPNEPSIIDFCLALSEGKGVKGVDVLVREVDRKVETVRIMVNGKNLDFAEVKNIIESLGASIHSVDHVSSGEVPGAHLKHA